MSPGDNTNAELPPVRAHILRAEVVPKLEPEADPIAHPIVHPGAEVDGAQCALAEKQRIAASNERDRFLV
jgi:hypothetical protein